MAQDAELRSRIQEIIESLNSEQLAQLWGYLEALVGDKHAGFAEARVAYQVRSSAEKAEERRVMDMTVDELADLIHVVVDQALFEMMHDPDAGFELREEFVEELEQAWREERDGKMLSLEEVVERLGLE
ncbi:MAG: hypothetical protein GXP42_01060 [Chloroflexi bacterium]|nr:hypothetical protein [Chloroflexota bacterium]